MKNSNISVLLALICLIPAISFSQEYKKIPPEKPKLIIGIVIDQMRYDLIDRFWNKFGDGGFRKIIQEGTQCKNASFQYLINETAVGNATISSGTLPSYHGIIADNWYVSLQDKIINCVEDERYSTVGGSYEAGRCSPSKLMVSTIGDELKMSNEQKSKVIGIALDNEAAILSTGHSADYAFWYDIKTGKWITSSFYTDSLPGWVNEFNNKDIARLYLQGMWEPLLPLDQYSESLPDMNKYEKGINGKSVFPYDLKKMSFSRNNQLNYEMIKFTPFGNSFTKDLAIAAIANENLGKDEYTDILTVGFSANEYMARIFNLNSVEMEDAFIRLDKELEHFFTFIDDFVGNENVLIYITSDHGISYTADYLNDQKIPSGEFNPFSALTLLGSYLNAVYGEGDWVKYYWSQHIYLNHELIEDSRIPLDEFQNRVAMFLIQFEGVSNAITAHTLQTTSFQDGIFRKIQNGYHQKRSGDVVISLAPGWNEKNTNSTVFSSSSPGDARVPLLWYGWKIGRSTINRQVNMTDIAPTLAFFLDISWPNASTGEPILEIIR
jgi:predicted AlkP superfamily pyrophosphatase or phosphodiesterase